MHTTITHLSLRCQVTSGQPFSALLDCATQFRVPLCSERHNPHYCPPAFGLSLTQVASLPLVVAGEGAVQVLYNKDFGGRSDPILAAVGQLQFEVVQSRMEQEYGVETTLEPLPYQVISSFRCNGRLVDSHAH